jgi:hypothetical protein
MLISDDLNICVEALLKKSKNELGDNIDGKELRKRFRKNKD